MNTIDGSALSNLEYHVLLALAGGPLHGYALALAVAEESGGTLTPRPGSMYRVIARLMSTGLVDETEPVDPEDPHPGLARKYYALTAAGRAALRSESRRLGEAVALAERRLRAARGRA
jgi:PadR family transcriptional regulator, regulatory protein PadR